MFFIIFMFSFKGFGDSQRVDLDDLMIRGELFGDDRFQILSRDQHDLGNYIRFRRDFRQEILLEKPKQRPVTDF